MKHYRAENTNGGVDARVDQQFAELDKTRNLDEREDLLEAQLGCLGVLTRRAYVRAIASQAFDTAQDLSCVLSQLGVALRGSACFADIDRLSGDLYQLLEALTITGGAEDE